jgi:hypothetical protein
MMRTGTLLAAAWAAVGCNATLPPNWASDAWLHPAGRPFPAAPAVDLYRADRVLLYPARGGGYSLFQHAEAIEIRTEAGKAFADVRVAFGSSGELTDLRARRVDPDGTVTVIPRERMLEQKAEAEKNTATSLRVFRFPDVRVGSILEYVATIQYDNAIFNYHPQPVLTALPTLHYEGEFHGNKHIIYGVRAYNFKTHLNESEDADMRHVTFAVDDLPAHVNEDWAPHPSFDEPWWAYGIRAMTNGTVTVDELNEWNTALRAWGTTVYSGKLTSGLSAKVPFEACQNKACRVDAAVDFVRTQTRFTGFGTFDAMRPMKQVLEGHQATGFEKAVLLRQLLDDGGVEARVAGTARAWTTAVDLEFPTVNSFNHLLVHVPLQKAIPVPLWIDPSCEYCRAGELPAETRGVDAVIFYNSVFLSQPQASVVRTIGSAPAADEEAESYEAVLDERGRLEVHVTDVLRGVRARETRLYKAGWTDEQRLKNAEDLAHRRSPTAEVSSFKDDPCDPLKGECRDEFAFSISGYATLDGNRLIVPLSILNSRWTESLTREKRARDVVLTRADRLDETLRIHLPAGFEPLHLPENVSVDSSALRVSLSAEKEPGGIVIHRRSEERIGRFPKGEYPGIRQAVRKFVEWRNLTLVLERKAVGAGGSPVR